MKKRLFSSVVLAMFFMTSLVFAKRDITTKDVEKMDSWQESFDLSSKKTGKYNILVTAKDKGGNVAYGGPFNIYIDPESDRPVAGITNPQPNMRVPGNLNIVGTCIDDDNDGKPKRVWLIFDGDEENKKLATGTQFWSYYLDTTELAEGPHTIEVYGEDFEIDEGKKEATGKRVKVTWNLDRRQPVTEVTNHGLGELVSGKVTLKGTVFDGNGIDTLFYSLDGGDEFLPTKIKFDKKETTWRFEIPIDTKKFEDGPAVVWFKATDKMGSSSIYSYLYFIDNTKPDVKILSPQENEICNGIFGIAGFAKDVIGISKLSWEFNGESGDFELIPGNPYFYKEIDTRKLDKKTNFIVTAVDTLGNTVVLNYPIALNQELDKPIVEIEYPKTGEVLESEPNTYYLGGLAKDDDGVVSVTYKVDNLEEKTVETHGSFYVPLCDNYLKYGNHKVTVYATDLNGVKGNPVVVDFVAKGKAPRFESDILYGYKFHPEDNPTYKLNILSDANIESAKYVISGGNNFSIENPIEVSQKVPTNNLSVAIPLNDAPWGIVKIEVFATDTYGRTSSFRTLVNMKNLTRIETETPKVVFDDSRVEYKVDDDGNELGTIINDKKNPVTGYFLNSTDVGNIKSVALVPDTKFATVDFKKNVIILKAGVGEGESVPLRVRVTTDQGKTFDSKEIVFKSKLEVEAPILTLNDSGSVIDIYSLKEQIRLENESFKKIADETNANLEEGATPVEPEVSKLPSTIKVSGTLKSDVTLKTFGYKLYKVSCSYGNGKLNISEKVATDEFVELPLPSGKDSSKKFEFELPYESFVDGVTAIEIVADNTERVSEVLFVSNVRKSPIRDAKGKELPPPAPIVKWIEGEDIYYVSIYQGQNLAGENVELSDNHEKFGFGKFLRSEIKEASKKYSVSVNYKDSKQPVVSEHSTVCRNNGKIFIRKIGDYEFANGMFFTMPKDASNIPVRVEIESKIPVKSISYVVTGDKVPGGVDTLKGDVLPQKNETHLEKIGDNLYQAEFVISNQPSRLSTIKVSATTDLPSDKISYTGKIAIVREQSADKIQDSAKVYWNPERAKYDKIESQWILSDSFEFEGFANVYGPVTLSVVGAIPGVSVVTGDYVEPVTTDSSLDNAKAPNVTGNPRKIIVKFEKDGFYKNVSIQVKDSIGNIYTSEAVNVLVDNEKPEVKITSPAYHQWIQNTVKFSAIAKDINGIVKTEYSLDDSSNIEEKTWVPFKADNSVIELSFTNKPEGLRTIWVRVTDKSGKVTVESVGFQRDITPPEVKVIIPALGDVINGENTIAFIAKDNGNLIRSEYLYKKTTGEGKAAKTEEFKKDVDVTAMINTHVGTLEKPLDQKMTFSFFDEAGNLTTIDKWDFIVDQESDLPIAEVHLPEEDAVLTRDFTISGIVTDDDGKSKIWWKIDNGEYKELPEYDNSFSIDIPLNTMTDNEHSVTVYAVDINGVKGHEFKRNFKISLEEPKGAVLTPPITETVRGTVKLTGNATDQNGISKVYVSLDNGNSYDEAIGNYKHEDTECKWSYEFDTRVIEDGTHVVFIKIVDWYGIEGLYSSLINIDNTAPEINLELPLDDSVSTGKVFFSGQTIDNIKLTDLFITVRSLDGKRVPAELAKTELVPDRIITQVLDISSLDDGFYNIELTGTDAANNITRVSRNFRLDKTSPVAKVDLLYPLNGEHVQSVFNVYGTAKCADGTSIKALKLYSDDKEIAETKLSESGYFKFTVNNEMMEEGSHDIKVIAVLNNDKTIISNKQYLIYNPIGPWITIDSFEYGSFAFDRPYIKGKAGYVVSEDEKLAAKQKGISKRKAQERKDALAAKSIKQIDLSLDNGMTFVTLSDKKDWRYRIENEDIREGYHFLLVRAKMNNGEVAVTRCIVQVDSTKPTIKLISPGAGGRYNQKLEFSGLAHDDIELKSVELALRKGDKAAYEIPGFIQGLYLDTQFWGATFWSAGAGLSFFDDNVKLQVQYGQFTEAQWKLFNTSTFRYGGTITGMKLLANVYYLPFRYYLGPDWEWLSLNVSLGANFSHFSETGSGSAQTLSAMLLQVEFPKVTRDRKATMFRTFSFYTEGQLWFIPSDVASDDIATLVPQISFGLRAYVF